MEEIAEVGIELGLAILEAVFSGMRSPEEPTEKKKMGLELTKRAILEVKKVKEEQELSDGAYLRVGIEGGGCAGFNYKLTFEEDEIDKLNDKVYEFDGVRAVVDRKSELYLDGTTIDFYEGLDQRGFKFDNPNATKSCGCGHSFQA